MLLAAVVKASSVPLTSSAPVAAAADDTEAVEELERQLRDKETVRRTEKLYFCYCETFSLRSSEKPITC